MGDTVKFLYYEKGLFWKAYTWGGLIFGEGGGGEGIHGSKITLRLKVRVFS